MEYSDVYRLYSCWREGEAQVGACVLSAGVAPGTYKQLCRPGYLWVDWKRKCLRKDWSPPTTWTCNKTNPNSMLHAVCVGGGSREWIELLYSGWTRAAFRPCSPAPPGGASRPSSAPGRRHKHNYIHALSVLFIIHSSVTIFTLSP